MVNTITGAFEEALEPLVVQELAKRKKLKNIEREAAKSNKVLALFIIIKQKKIIKKET